MFVNQNARKINKIIFTSSVAFLWIFPQGDTDECSGEPSDFVFSNYGRTKYLAEQVYKVFQKAG